MILCVRPPRGLLVLLALGLGACDGGTATDSDTDPPTDTDVPLPYSSDWDGVQQMFTDHCDSCHPSQNGFDLRMRISEDVSGQVMDYIVPGDPSASRLWNLITPSDLTFPMPPSGHLPADQTAHVAEWIQAGAAIP